MKQIKIIRMLIENFKKIKTLEIDFAGKNMHFIGKNETGKTSVFDAFSWNLFGKDSLGRADNNPAFEIKPKNQTTGEAIHNLETVVELTLSVDGNFVVLKRLYREVYTKKRGDTEATFTGHETVYYINGVEKLQKDYKKFIEEEIVAEDLFKLITSVGAFTDLHPEKQRDVLFQLSKVDELDIINATPSLEPLKDHLILGNKVEDVIKIQEQDRKRIAKRRETEIPSELKVLHGFEYKNLDDNYNDAMNSEKLEASYKKLSDVEAKLASGTNQAEVQEFEKAKFEYERHISKLENEIDMSKMKVKNEHMDNVRTEKDKLSDLEFDAKRVNDEIKLLDGRIENGNKTITEYEAKKLKLYDEYDKIEEEVFTADKCSHCGQALPGDKLEESKEHFNLNRSERLEKIREEGSRLNAEIEKFKTAIEKFKSDAAKTSMKFEVLNKNIEEQKAVIRELENSSPTGKTDAILEKEKEIERYQERIKTLINQIKKAKEQGSNDVYEGAKREIKNEIDYLTTKKAEYQLRLQNEEKIMKLEKEQLDLNVKYEYCIKIITLGEKFRALQSDFIEKDINNKFKLVNFQLFHKAINGAITPTCVATSKQGVLFPSCSNGQRINMGLDIINSLQNIFGVSAPIFIDNAEAVSHWKVESDSQLIKMFVDPDVEILEIEEE